MVINQQTSLWSRLPGSSPRGIPASEERLKLMQAEADPKAALALSGGDDRDGGGPLGIVELGLPRGGYRNIGTTVGGQ